MKEILALGMLLLTTGAMAQRNPHQGEMHKAYKELTSEQRATLLSKKMVLALDLNTQQQKQVESLLKERFESRAKMRNAHREAVRDSSKRLSPEERYTRMNAHLDQEIAFQTEMKNILNESQFEMWKKRHNAKKMGHQKSLKEYRRGKAMHKAHRG
jgi:hypothetical protein